MSDELPSRPTPRPLTCPVCQARFRSVALCSRCGADLSVLMQLSAQAWLLRRAARQSLQHGDCQSALASVQAAERLHSTAEGRQLEFFLIETGL